MNTIRITNSRDIPFTVRVVQQGEHYGLDDVLVHDRADPLIEFYDARFPHTPHGQFVSRYYAHTLAASTENGLTLHGGVPDWVVDGPGFQRVVGIAQLLTTPSQP